MFREDPINILYPPPIEFALPHVIVKLRKWNCNKIFLATEDVTIARTVKKFLGEICVTLPKEYIAYDGKGFISFYHTNRENDYFLRGKEYLMELGILSKCNSFIAANCSGTVGVMMMAENFENTYFFNLGRYGVVSLDGFLDDE